MGRRKLGPEESMLVAIKKVDFSPVTKEIHSHPFLWVIVILVLFFFLGNLFEVLWLLLRDLRRVFFRIIRYPKSKVREFATWMRHAFNKRYGKKKRKDRGLRKR